MRHELYARLALFANKNYALFGLSGFFATFGSGFAFVALSFYAYEHHGGLSGIVALFLCWWLPSVLLAPIIGTITDRYPRQWLIVLSNLVRGTSIGLFVLGLTFDFGFDVLLLAVIQGIFNALYMPAAIPLIYSLVDKSVLLRANATIDVIYEMGFILGLGLSGLVLARWGMNALLMVGAVLMLISGGLMLCLRAAPIAPSKHKLAIWQDYRLAWRYFVQTPVLYQPYAMQVIIKVLMMCIPTLLLPYVNEVLGQGTQVFAWFEMTIASGAIVGGLISPWLVDKWTPTGALAGLLALMAVGLVGMAVNDMWQVGLVIYWTVGVGLASWALAVTQSQAHCPENLQGRLQSMVEAVSGVVIVAVFACITVFEAWLPIAWLYAVFALMAVMGLFVLWQTYQPSLPKKTTDSPQSPTSPQR